MNKSFQTPAPVALHVDLPAGSVTVEAADTDESRVDVTGPRAEEFAVELQGRTLSVVAPKGRFLGLATDDHVVRVVVPTQSDLTARTGIVVTRGFGPGLPSLVPETELVVYRVAQEALTNVARHARAGRVHLGLTRRGDVLVLRVADDGVGLGGAPIGAGLQGMQERAQMIGGRLEVRANEGGGTEVLLDVPLDATGDAA